MVRYKREIVYEEKDATNNTNNLFESFTYTESLITRGSGINPVSYTHLDVYKRQTVDRPMNAPRDNNNGNGNVFESRPSRGGNTTFDRPMNAPADNNNYNNGGFESRPSRGFGETSQPQRYEQQQAPAQQQRFEQQRYEQPRYEQPRYEQCSEPSYNAPSGGGGLSLIHI